jgi:hypothetical protein
MPEESQPGAEQIRATEVIAALSLATDLGIGVPLEHNCQPFANLSGRNLMKATAAVTIDYPNLLVGEHAA